MIKNILITVLLIFLITLTGCDLFNKKDNGDNVDIEWIESNNTTVDSTIYYVSPAGDDSNDGKSENNPFKTLSKAIQNVHPGGTIRILPGTYNEGFGVEKLGSLAANILITGFNGMPVFDGQDLFTFAVYAENCKNITFNKMEFRNYTDLGIGASLSDLLEFTNLVVQNNGHAVQLVSWELEGYGIHVDESSRILIADNDVYENGPDPQVFPDRIMGTGIDTFGNTDGNILNNTSHHNNGGGILVEDSENVLVDGNEIYANDLDATVDEWWDGGIWLDGGSNVTISNNNIHDNLGPGIEISDEDNQNPTGYKLENNICQRNYYGIFIWNFGTNDWPDASILTNVNNVFSDNTVQDVWIVDWY